MKSEWIPLNEKSLMCLDCKSRYSRLSEKSNVCPMCGAKSVVKIELACRIISNKTVEKLWQANFQLL